jgi:uncharacterized protein (DUF58 family)
MTHKTGISLAPAVASLRVAAVLAGVAVLAAACGGNTPNAAATSPDTPSVAVTPVVVASLKCHASATRPEVAQDATVGIKVRTVAHAKLVAIYDKSLVTGKPTAQASARGRRTLWFRTTGAKPGSRIFIDVSVSRHDRAGACHTSFRLRPRAAVAVAPTPRPTRPAMPPTSPPPTHAACFPVSDEDTCYQPGEFCRDSDHGASGVAGDGESIRCEDNDGWRWEPV